MKNIIKTSVALILLICALVYSSSSVSAGCASNTGGRVFIYGGQSCNSNGCDAKNPNCNCWATCPHSGISEGCGDYGTCSSCVGIRGINGCSGERCLWNGSTSCNATCYGGTNCWGQAVGGIGHGGQVCGTTHTYWACNNGGFYNTGNACGECTYCGSCGGSVNSCASGAFQDDADWGDAWRWSCLGNGWCGGASCAIAYPPVTGQCGGTVNTCSTGNFSDVADNSTQYLWNCLGYYGGGNASCAINMPTPTPTPVAVPHFKVKDTSFYKIGSLSVDFPVSPAAYDVSDTVSGGYFNQGQAGMVITSGSVLSAGSGGTAISGSAGSARNWTALNYSGGNPFTSTSFLNYVKAKKNTTAETYATLPTTGTGGTYSITDTAVTISGSAPTFRNYITIVMPTATSTLDLSVADLGKDGVTFIVNGNVNVNGNAGTFNSSNRPFAVISTGTITFANTLTEADGLFVGNAINFGTGTTPLKIVGNVSSATAASVNRDRQTAAASLFIVFDPRHYMSIADKVSTVKSSWTQLQ